MNRNLGLLLQLLAAALAVAGMAPAALAGELPPPGLYRIDFDGAMAFAGNSTQVQMTTDGASGDTAARWTAGAHSANRQYKGDAPVTHCVKAVQGGVPPLPPQALTCTGQTTTKTKDGVVLTATCPHGKTRIAIRQLDKDRWEYLTEVAMVRTGAAPQLAAMEPMLKHQAQHGETAEVRAQARQQLADLPRMQKEADTTYASTVAQMEEELRKATDPDEKAAVRAALANLRPGTPTMQARSRAIWTRIANACKGGK
jgi:hypothetical protein